MVSIAAPAYNPIGWPEDYNQYAAKETVSSKQNVCMVLEMASGETEAAILHVFFFFLVKNCF